MKRIKLTLIAVTLSLACSAMAHAGEDFDRGYRLGFKEGYRKVEGQFAIAPICPIPPIPAIGEDTFFGGYNEGFLAGMSEAED
jgi:hypothetical protein